MIWFIKVNMKMICDRFCLKLTDKYVWPEVLKLGCWVYWVEAGSCSDSSPDPGTTQVAERKDGQEKSLHEGELAHTYR